MKKLWIFLSAIVLCLAIAVSIYMTQGEKAAYITYNEFVVMAEGGQVEAAELTEGPLVSFSLAGDEAAYETDNPRVEEFKEFLLKNGIKVTEGSYISGISLVQGLAGIALMAAAILIARKQMGRQKSEMPIEGIKCGEQARVSGGFSDIAGNEEAKESTRDIIDFIKNPDKYSKYGARMPKGIIFYGEPGTGKTLMAKAVAAEAGVPFYAVSGSDFVQMYVGVGASRVRDLFAKARRNGKAVIFIDEIDALGKKRTSRAAGGNDERDQTLNALLTEMSGFSSGEGIVVIAATNRLDTLDDALLRPGRFDRQIEISLPDKNARARILELYAKNKPLGSEVSLEEMAAQTLYFSGAMLENLMNEAAIFAAKDEAECISRKHLDKAYYTVLAGSEKQDRTLLRPEDRRITAIHESGHAILSKHAGNRITKLTIIPSTKGAGGFCVSIPDDRMYLSKQEIEGQIMVSLAGRAAEELQFGKDKVTTGASNDIEKANSLALNYVTKYGMSETFGLLNPDVIEGTAVQDECRGLLGKLYENTLNILSGSSALLENMSGALLERESLNEAEIDAVFATPARAV